jgi:hypothetical protein
VNPGDERRVQPPVLDPRLVFSFGPDAWRLATIDEHAKASGVQVDEFLTLIEAHLEAGWLGVEAVDGNLFLRTATTNGEPAITAPNLWETLRGAANLQLAAHRWSRIRELERGGWHAETRHRILDGRFSHLRPTPWLAVTVQQRGVGVIVDVASAALGQEGGILDSWSQAGEPLVAVVCEPGALPSVVAEVRSWVLSRGAVAGGRWMSVLVLEAPSYTATLLRCTDNSVTPVAFAQSETH